MMVFNPAGAAPVAIPVTGASDQTDAQYPLRHIPIPASITTPLRRAWRSIPKISGHIGADTNSRL